MTPRMLNLPQAAMALLLMTTSLAAQERMRSPDYDGEDAIEACYGWQVDFAFEKCERRAIAGQPGLVSQVYTLADGAKRTLTADPATAMAEPVAAAADAADTPAQTPAPIPGAVEAGISAQVARRDAVAASTNGMAGADDAKAEADQRPSIVAEEFVLPPVVAFIPGRSEIMPMATGHLNRIETPFKAPEVRTSAEPSALNVEFDQNFVYVSVTQPVTLFIHDKGFPDPAIVVSLVPQLIAPRQVKITLPPNVMETVRKNAASQTTAANNAAGAAGPATNSRGVKRERVGAAPTNSLAEYIKTFSEGRVPAGFQQVSIGGFKAEAFCDTIPGVTFSFNPGAGIASKDYIVVRGMATSTRPRVALDERNCARNPETLAVAFHPRTIIGPGEPTDFFVLIRRPSAPIKTARGN